MLRGLCKAWAYFNECTSTNAVPTMSLCPHQCRLASRGMMVRSSRQLLDLVRAELDQYLSLQGLTRAQVGERLGYGDTAAYLHARKRWAAD